MPTVCLLPRTVAWHCPGACHRHDSDLAVLSQLFIISRVVSSLWNLSCLVLLPVECYSKASSARWSLWKLPSSLWCFDTEPTIWLMVCDSPHSQSCDVTSFHLVPSCAEWLCDTDNPATSPLGYCPRPHCVNARQNKCREDLSSFPLENWRRPPGRPCTTWMKTYPAGSEIQQPLREWSNCCGSESSTLETDVYVCRYALLVVHASNDDVVCSSWRRRGSKWRPHLLRELPDVQKLWWSAGHSLSNTKATGKLRWNFNPLTPTVAIWVQL